MQDSLSTSTEQQTNRDSSNDEPLYITYICCGCGNTFHSERLPWFEFKYCLNCLDPSKSVVITKPIPPAPTESFSDLVEDRYKKYKPCIEGSSKSMPRMEHAYNRVCQLMFPFNRISQNIPGKTRILSQIRAAGAKYGLDFQQITGLMADSYLHSRAVETMVIELLCEQRIHEARAHEGAEDVAPIYAQSHSGHLYKDYVMSLFEQGVGWDAPKDDPSEDDDPDKLALIG